MIPHGALVEIIATDDCKGYDGLRLNVLSTYTEGGKRFYDLGVMFSFEHAKNKRIADYSPILKRVSESNLVIIRI